MLIVYISFYKILFFQETNKFLEHKYQHWLKSMLTNTAKPEQAVLQECKIINIEPIKMNFQMTNLTGSKPSPSSIQEMTKQIVQTSQIQMQNSPCNNNWKWYWLNSQNSWHPLLVDGKNEKVGKFLIIDFTKSYYNLLCYS